MTSKTIWIAIVACLACSCTNDDTVPELSPTEIVQPAHGDAKQQDSCTIDVGGEDFGFDNDNPPTGIITPTI